VAAAPPREPIARLPTRVQRLGRLSARLGCDLWIKRDDEAHPEIAGNKARKLEYLIPEWRAAGWTLVAYGPHGSNWLRSLAWAARRWRLPLRVVSFPQVMHEAARANREALRRAVRVAEAADAAAFACRIALEAPRCAGRTARLGPMGGTSPRTTLAYVCAAEELAAQDAPPPDFVFVPLGTCGTAAGLAAGFALLGQPVMVVGVRITSPWIASVARARRQAHAAASLLGREIARVPLIVEGRAYGGRYARPTVESREAARRWFDEEGIALDPAYTAKAAAALELWAAEGRLNGRTVLFWKTDQTGARGAGLER
jgi:1-aminocyclopropane-1-carboxylate deaminase/D-cysteine desulfhydrase-like pyridoxal-dependent ACC family enzyme